MRSTLGVFSCDFEVFFLKRLLDYTKVNEAISETFATGNYYQGGAKLWGFA